MRTSRARLLIVDDDFSMRTLLSQIFVELGYDVRTCEAGVPAESEILKGIPDVMLSDLKPAGMFGVEFFRAVRLWFPSIRVIAMGLAFSSNAVPPGVAADAFYEKSAGMERLIEMVNALTERDRPDSRLSMERLFGFQVFEAIPSASGAERTVFPIDRMIVFPIPRMERPGMGRQGEA
jgi:DNA-binding NtrC family response regulator